MLSFMHINFNKQQIPNATTLPMFRHMPEANKLDEKIFSDVNNHLAKAGLMTHDISEAENLTRENDTAVYRGSGYLIVVNQPLIKGENKKSRIAFQVNKRPSGFKMANEFKCLNCDKKRNMRGSQFTGKSRIHCSLQRSR